MLMTLKDWASKDSYDANPEKKKEASQKHYDANIEKKKESSQKRYNANPEKKREASQKTYKENTEKCKKAFKDYYYEHREEVCCNKRKEYALRPPNEIQVKSNVEGLLVEFMGNPEIKLRLTLKLCKQFPSYTEKLSNKMKAKTACRLATRNLVHDILSLRKTNAGKFLKHVREVNSLTIDSKTEFGDPSHSTHSEPFYYETAYLHGFQPTKLTVDKAKKCILIENVVPTSDQFVNNFVVYGGWSSWTCGSCNVTCGDGTRNCTRRCNNPTPACGGNYCPGSSIDGRSCFINNCGT